jgi:xanthosine utilization system XapX-like protein
VNQPAPFLIWEDELPGADRWWLARARENGPQGRTDYFIAEDDVTDSIVAVALRPKARAYHVIAAVPIDDGDAAGAVASAKSMVAQWCAAPHDTPGVWGWRIQRMAKIAWRNLPIAMGGLGAGALLGTAVALFAISSGVVGWPMAVMGMLIGASAGPAIKLIVDRRHSTGAWARFAVVTCAAMIGAALSAGGMLTLFWN